MERNAFSVGGLNLNLEERPDETIVRCSGRITKDAARWFRAEIRDRVIPISRGKDIALTCRIVLDLSRVSYVDSNGLDAILALRKDGQKSSCDVEIINQNPAALKHGSRIGMARLLGRLKLFLGTFRSS